MRDLVPGTWFDDEAVALVHTILGPIEAALGDTEKQGELLGLLSEEKWSDAAQLLKDFAIDHIQVADVKQLAVDHLC